MRALILWADAESANLGVRTLARGTASLLETTFGAGGEAVDISFQGYGAGDAPVRVGYPRRQAKRLVTPGDELVDWLRTFDLVVDTRGGDSFTDAYGLRRLTTMSLMAELVRRAGVPLVLGPQTIGPFETRRGRALARRTLRGARRVLVRDPVSADVSGRLGRAVDALASDVVFALPSDPAVQVTRDVVLNVSGLLWNDNPHVEPERYRDFVERLTRELIRRGRRVSLLAHVLAGPLADNDVPALEGLAGRLDADVEQLVPTGLDDARAMLASASVVVGSRMHACLNALSLGRPAVALAYSRKFAPLLRAIGWPHSYDLREPGDHVDEVVDAIEDPRLVDGVGEIVARAEEQLERARSVLAGAI